MPNVIKVSTIALILACAAPVSQADAAGANRTLQRAQNPIKPETCKPKWPYVVLTCVA